MDLDLKGKTGCGLYITQNGTTKWEGIEHLGTLATVFQAEVLAILRASQQLQNHKMQMQMIKMNKVKLIDMNKVK